MQLILASASEGRKKLLSLLKIPFKIIPSTLDEDKIISETPIETLKLRAKLKGEEVAGLLSLSPKSPKLPRSLREKDEFLILSADSGAIINNQLIGKPKDYKDAVKILKTLSGKTHEFVTAVYILSLSPKSPKLLKSLRKMTFDRSLVTFRKLSDEDIKLYLSITNYTKYAGGYAIASSQDFITNIEGSISNVIGLPLEKVIPMLRENNLFKY